MKIAKNYKIIDALYGEIVFSEEICALLWCPLIQRLRHIRLSNIDSFSMPGIANISRYEHSIGVGFLATKVPFFRRISHHEKIILQAAALLHDIDITPFGHLVQEAFEYVSAGYEHEKELLKIARGTDSQEIGGLKRQLLFGRESGLDKWALKVFGAEYSTNIDAISQACSGTGEYGPYISSDVDLDNLDNVVRIAYHMGLDVDRLLPLRVAQGMDNSQADNKVIFHASASELLKKWLAVRRRVYSLLMPSRLDFAAKSMLISAAVSAYKCGVISKTDWSLTDMTFIQRLLSSDNKRIRDTVQRWMAGELWDLSDIFWLRGAPPKFKDLLSFCDAASGELGRECFAYRIKDKRNRELNVTLSDGETLRLGSAPDKWLIGVVSPKRKEFTVKENGALKNLAAEYFESSLIEEPFEASQGLSFF